jgi:DNA-binding CsgD family transcriptional regulator
MEFPITNLLDYESSVSWITEHFHPTGFKCPGCGASISQAREFRRTQCSQLIVYQCRQCDTAYNLYSGTIFQQTHLTPMQVVLLMRGICKGESSKELAAELGLNYFTVLTLRHATQANAEKAQPETPLPDEHTETDEMFQNAGEKR